MRAWNWQFYYRPPPPRQLSQHWCVRKWTKGRLSVEMNYVALHLHSMSNEHCAYNRKRLKIIIIMNEKCFIWTWKQGKHRICINQMMRPFGPFGSKSIVWRLYYGWLTLVSHHNFVLLRRCTAVYTIQYWIYVIAECYL